METKKNIRLVVERIFTKTSGAPVNFDEKIGNRFSKAVSQIEQTYDVKFTRPAELTLEQISDICYNVSREKALSKVRRFVKEYEIKASEVFPFDQGVSVH